MMKRETLRDKRRNVHKMSYYVDNNAYAQVIDSHLEALDEIEELREKLEIIRGHLERPGRMRVKGEPCSDCGKFIPEGVPAGPIHDSDCSRYVSSEWLSRHTPPAGRGPGIQ